MIGPLLRLTLFQLRRDRWQLLVWALGMAVLTAVSAGAVSDEFAAEEDRRGFVILAAANPALLFLRGVPDGTSIGAVVFFQLFAFLAVMAGLMSTFLVVRHSRGDEEAGRSELLAATPLRREVPLAATLLAAGVANLLLGAAVAVGLGAGDLATGGAVLTGTATAAVGLAFAGLAAVAAQLMPTSRGANGAAAGMVGIAYLLRGVGDALGTPSDDLLSATSSWPTWLSPIGWGEQVRAFTDADPLPLLLPLALAALTGGAALTLRARRDLGSSLVPERPGRARAGWTARSALGLAVRLQRGVLIGWAIGGVLLGALAGLIAPAIADAVSSNAGLQAILERLAPGTTGDPVDVFAASIFGIAGFLAAAAGVQAVLRLRAEEADGRAEALLATPLRRLTWMAGHLAVGALSVLVVLLATGLAGGLAFLAAGDSPDRLGSSIGATLAHAPAALVFVAVAALLFAVLPRLTVPLGWGLLALGLVLGQLGDLLRLPEWLRDASPFTHSSGLPAESLDVPATLILLAVAVAGAALATAAFRRRDLVS